MIISYEKFVSTLERLRPYLKKSEVTWINRLNEWAKISDSFNLDSYMKGLASLELVAFRSEVSFIYKFCREFENISPFQARFWLSLERPRKKRNKLKIPSDEEIKNSMPKLKQKEQLFLAIMVSSGRRGADVRRIKSSKVVIREEAVEVTVERDKTSSVPVTFSFSWDRSVFGNLSPSLKNTCSENENPFLNISGQRLRRVLPFSLHACRNRRALQLIFEGQSIEETCSAIGWSTQSSFVRYTRLSLTEIRKTPDFGKVIEKVNNILN